MRFRKLLIPMCGFLLLTVCAATAGAQTQLDKTLARRFAFGVVAGGYLNSDFKSHYIPTPGFNPDIVESEAGGYIVGPFVNVRLIPHFSVEAAALYKPLHYKQAASFRNGAVLGFAPATVVTWQFPILAKYEFVPGRVRPFIEAGPSFRTAGNLNQSDPSRVGVTIGAGLTTRWSKVALAPRVRYTRWANDPWSANVRTRADQIEFLVGISYGQD